MLSRRCFRFFGCPRFADCFAALPIALPFCVAPAVRVRLRYIFVVTIRVQCSGLRLAFACTFTAFLRPSLVVCQTLCHFPKLAFLSVLPASRSAKMSVRPFPHAIFPLPAPKKNFPLLPSPPFPPNLPSQNKHPLRPQHIPKTPHTHSHPTPSPQKKRTPFSRNPLSISRSNAVSNPFLVVIVRVVLIFLVFRAACVRAEFPFPNLPLPPQLVAISAPPP